MDAYQPFPPHSQPLAPRRGRPKGPEPGIRLCVWVSVREYDQLTHIALTHKMSLSALARHLLVLDLKDYPS